MLSRLKEQAKIIPAEPGVAYPRCSPARRLIRDSLAHVPLRCLII
jgi:hypothetical protein